MLFNQAALVQILSEPYISAMHLFISFFVTDFVRKNIKLGINFYMLSSFSTRYSNGDF